MVDAAEMHQFLIHLSATNYRQKRSRMLKEMMHFLVRDTFSAKQYLNFTLLRQVLWDVSDQFPLSISMQFVDGSIAIINVQFVV